MSIDTREKAVAYLLGELSAEELEGFEAEILADEDLRTEVDRLQPVVAKLEAQPDEAWEPVEPPPLDIAAIVGADAAASRPADVRAETESAMATGTGVHGESDPGTERSKSRRPRRSLAERFGFAWPSVAAAAFSALLILAVGIGVGTQLGGDESSTGEPVTALSLDRIGDEVPDGASGEVVLTSDTGGTGDQLTLDVSGLKQTGDREFYEFWLLGDDGELVSLGSFRVPADGSSQVEVPLPVDPGKYSYFDVSIEPENGSPDHSGRSVLRGLTPS